MSAVSEEILLEQNGLAEHVNHAVKAYLSATNSKDANLNLYQLIIEEV